MPGCVVCIIGVICGQCYPQIVGWTLAGSLDGYPQMTQMSQINAGLRCLRHRCHLWTMLSADDGSALAGSLVGYPQMTQMSQMNANEGLGYLRHRCHLWTLAFRRTPRKASVAVSATFPLAIQGR